MAQQLFAGPLDKNDDWGKVARASGIPASGAAVQAFIKGELQKKFGYIHYDEASRQNLVFADDKDFETWRSDKNANAALILARFDAPAPASLDIFNQSNLNEESLLTAKGRKIYFNFFVKNSSGSASYEGVSVRAAFNLSGLSYVRNWTPDKDTYSNSEIGTHVEIDIDDYLTVAGDYEITVTVTTLTTNVSTTLVFWHTVTNLKLNSNFNAGTPIDIANGTFTIPYEVIGGGSNNKMLEVYIDGNLYNGREIDLGGRSTIDGDLRIDMSDESVFTLGKHELQLRAFIQSKTDSNKRFYSDTKYYNFVIVDSRSAVNETYVLYLGDFETSTEGELVDITKLSSFTVQQYTDIELNFIAVNTNDEKVSIKTIFEKTDLAEDEAPIVEEQTQEVNNGEKFTLKHQFQNGGKYVFNVFETNTTPEQLQFTGDVTVTEFSIGTEKIEEQRPDSLVLKYIGLNRTNTTADKEIWPNIAKNAPANSDGVLSNVTFKEGQSGWENHSLVLANGAYITIPVDLFSFYNNNLGFTFEIEFETFNSQYDEATVMDYSDPENVSYIKITATEASLSSNGGKVLTTNFKNDVKTKIDFVFYPLIAATDGRLDRDANMIQIYVNGVLDRVVNWGNNITTDSDSIKWVNPTTSEITIGNKTGDTGVKLYNIRAYERALSADEVFMNYVVDQGSKIPAIMEKNNIYVDRGNEKVIDLDLVKAKIPTLVLYTDFVSLNNRQYKKDNTMYNMEYFDPTDPSLNFFVRNGWISLQGTSSMNYPTKNLRPYFNKKAVEGEKKGNSFPFTIFDEAISAEPKRQGITVNYNFNTEFWPYSQYSGKKADESTEEYVDSNGILPYSVNSKVISKNEDETNLFHEIGQGKGTEYKIKLVTNYLANSNQNVELYRQLSKKVFELIRPVEDEEGNVTSVLSQATSIITSGGSVFISAYRPLLRNGWSLDSDEYWTYLRQLKYSGVKIFSRSAVKNSAGEVIGYSYKNLKKKAIERGKEYFGLGAYWRQYDNKPAEETNPNHYSGWTDRWTLKADYAESSMTHNAGVARLWGSAMKNVLIGGENVCQTLPQRVLGEHDSLVDIRTSCDGKPVVLFVREPIGWEEVDGKYTGKLLWSDPRFVGLYIIMTDKSSTPLFGFEDIYDENGTKIWNASKTECWEWLGNGSPIGQGLTNKFDNGNEVTRLNAEEDEYGFNYGEDRYIFAKGINFEPRWPEDGTARHEGDPRFYQDDVFGVETNAIERYFTWLNFCMPALDYTVDGIDGYTFSPYVEFKDYYEAAEYKKTNPEKLIYIKWLGSGNDQFSKEGETYGEDKEVFTFDPEHPEEFPQGWTLCWYKDDIDYENVKKSASKKTIKEWFQEKRGVNIDALYKTSVYSFDSNNRFYTADGVIDTDEADKYAVETIAWKVGNTYRYIDNYGVEQTLPSGQIDPDTFIKDSNGVNIVDKTFMDFFNLTWKDYVDTYKVAAYYVYFTRFGAVDQTVKNQMMTTNDGKLWYYINYDNDTVLGVRNDAILSFNWDFDRNTWDYNGGNSFAFAGAKNVLWNNLEFCSEFMNMVNEIDSAMQSSNLLTAKTVLEYLDEKQMNTWCERLYNAQEEIKYISTYKNNISTTPFLAFCQGTRQSHRDWWVTNRWLLYDSIWESVNYRNNRSRMYFIANANQDNQLPFLNITASSRYKFRVTTNGAVFEDPELNGPSKDGNSQLLYLKSESTIGNPIIFYGTHKVKVMNFRPGAGLIAGILTLADADAGGTNWLRTEAPTMTKLLLGTGTTNVAVQTIGNIDEVTSLEEIDIRRCNALTLTPILFKLNNLHIYRASGSTINNFEPAVGSILYEVSLPESITSLKLDTVSFEKSNTEYIVYQEGENNDALPYSLDNEGNVSGIYTNDTAFKYTTNKGIFDYTPTANLASVTIKDTLGFNSKKFIMDWRNALINKGKSLSACTLDLIGISWIDDQSMTISELLNFARGIDIDGKPISDGRFEFTHLNGVISVISDNPDNSSLTVDEYNKLIEVFGVNIFSTGVNGLRLTTTSGIFYQPEAEVNKYEFTSTEISTIRDYQRIHDNGGQVYELIKGDTIPIRANIFPKTNDKYVYIVTELTGTNATQYLPVNGVSTTTTEGGVVVTTKNDGSATIFANEAAPRNSVFAVTVVKEVDGKYISLADATGSTEFSLNDAFVTEYNKYVIYFKTIGKVVPATANINVYIDNELSSGKRLTISEEGHEYEIKIELPAETNAKIESVNIVPNGYDKLTLSEPVISSHDIVFTASSEITRGNTTFDLNVTINFNSLITPSRQITIASSIVPIYPEHMKLVLLDEEGNETTTVVNNGDTITYKTLGHSVYKVKFDESNYNVKIVDRNVEYTNSTDINLTGSVLHHPYGNGVNGIKEDELFDITVGATTGSIYLEDNVVLKYTNKFDDVVTFSFMIKLDMVYPDRTGIKATHHFTVNESNINKADIYLTNNNSDIDNAALVLDVTAFAESSVKDRDTSVLYELNFRESTFDWDFKTGYENHITYEVKKGDHGNNVITLNIPAENNQRKDIKLTGEYQLTYDTNDNGLGPDDAFKNVPFEITVHYNVYDANSFNDINDINEFYLVDQYSKFYKLPENAEDITVDTSIVTAIRHGIKFVAIGKKIGTVGNYHGQFAYLVTEDTIDLFKSTIVELFDETASDYMSSGQTKYEFNENVATGYRGQEFDGVDNTADVLNVSAKSSSSKFRQITNLLSGNVSVYVPTYKELNAFLGGFENENEISTIVPLDAYINALNTYLRMYSQKEFIQFKDYLLSDWSGINTNFDVSGDNILFLLSSSVYSRSSTPIYGKTYCVKLDEAGVIQPKSSVITGNVNESQATAFLISGIENSTQFRAKNTRTRVLAFVKVN